MLSTISISSASLLRIAFGGLAAWLGFHSPAFAAAIRLTPDYDYPGRTFR